MAASDPSQRRLDRFLSSTPTPPATASSASSNQGNDDPMQIDSEPRNESKSFLGLFRQQSIIPVITIENTNRKSIPIIRSD